jgi:DNA-binding beta-propeller fold protein YncE
VTIFDLATLAPIGSVKTGANPDAILYEPTTHRVFAFNGRSHDAIAIEGATGAPAGTVALGGKPEFAVADGKGTIYVNIEDKAELVSLSSRDLNVVSRWPLAPCQEPTGLALDAAKRRLFVGCSNERMAVVDADTGKLLATLPIGRGVDGTAFDPGEGLAFSSNGEGTLTVVREDAPGHFVVVENVKTQPGARTLALDPVAHRIYLSTARFGPPPPPTPGQPHPRGAVQPGSFVILVVGR